MVVTDAEGVAKIREGGDGFLRCYLGEKEPTLKNFAKVVRSLDERQLE